MPYVMIKHNGKPVSRALQNTLFLEYEVDNLRENSSSKETYVFVNTTTRRQRKIRGTR